MATKTDSEPPKTDEVYEYDDFDPKTGTEDEKDKYIECVRGDFKYDLIAHDNYIQNFDAYEAMLISKPYDSVSKKISNGLSDGRTTTIYQERAARVCGQLPVGEMKAAGKKDAGAAAALDIILQKYVYPNANAQAPLLEKFRNWQFYSSVYGFMPMFYDWNPTETGYIGPDCWLWHPRNFIPQIGRASIDDMDYVNAISYCSEDELEEIQEEADDEESGWDKDEIKVLLNLVSEKLRSVDNSRDSLVTRERQSRPEKGRIMLATRYEAGDDGNWVTFAPEYNGVVIRVLRNPHKNGRIPFVIKYATPLFDNFYGLGDFQRAKPLQFASDGLDNFYFAGIKRGLYPPTIINPAGVIKSSITQDPGAIYLETVPNSIREYKTAPVGLSTYQAAKTMMNGAMLNQAGTTDTSQTAANTADPGFSKTPEGLAQQAQRESSRDNQDRFYLESKIEILLDRMMGLFGAIGTEDIPIDLFVEDFEDIDAAGWSDDLKSMLDVSESEQSARMTIKPDFFKNLSTRFKIDPGTTAMTDKKAQLTSLENFVKSMGSMQNEMVEMKNQGMTIDWTLVAKIQEQLSDVPQMGKIFRKMNVEEQKTWMQNQEYTQTEQPKVSIRLNGDLNPQEVGTIGQQEGWNQNGQNTNAPPAANAPGTPQQTGPAADAAGILPPSQSGKIIQDPAIAEAHANLGALLGGK